MLEEEEFLREIGDLLRKQRAQAEKEAWLVNALMVVSWLGLIVLGVGVWAIL